MCTNTYANQRIRFQVLYAAGEDNQMIAVKLVAS